MAETKIVSLEAIENIQQLKDNIKALKQEVDTLTVGSEEYNSKVLELASNQRALKLAMTGVYDSMQEVANASRQDTDALNATVAAAKEGTATYNQMSTALGAFKTQIKDIPKYLSEQDQAIGKLNPKYQEISSKIQTLDSTLKSLDADNGVFSRNVGNYLGALQEWGGTMGQVQQIGSQLMSGIMSIIGVLSLFGVDTENTKDSLQALVPILAVLNSAKGIGGLAKMLTTATAGQKALAVATVTSTAANTANATAMGAATVATEAETVAQDTLNKTMLANPILAIIAGITALVGVIAKYISNTNKAAQETNALKEEQEKLNKKFEKQNEDLEREQKIKAAQGVSNQVLLAQKKQLITAQKAETEALMANIQGSIKQMKADSAWVRFWKGENKQIKNLEEQLKSLTSEVEAYDRQLKNIDTDIQVDSINEGKNAAKKYAATLSTEVKNAVDVANGAIKSQKTELQSLNDEYKTNASVLVSGLTAVTAILSKAKKGSKEYIQAQKDMDTINKGITANQERYKKALKEYKASDYIKGIARDFAELKYEVNGFTQSQQNFERLMDTVLGFSDATALLAKSLKTGEDLKIGSTQATQALISTYEGLGQVIEADIVQMTRFSGELKNMSVNGLKWTDMIKLSEVDPKKLAEAIGEPLATAVGEWVKNDKNLQNAYFAAITETIAQGRALFNDELAKGTEGVDSAKVIRDQMIAALNAEFGDDPEMQAAIQAFLISLNEQINEVIASDEYTLDFGEKLSALMSSTAITNSFDRVLKIVDDFNAAYVDSTAEALNAVANLWETSIKWKYKKLVESGEMTEEEAEKQAQAEFQNVKALQIGVAAISTAAAIVQALADPTVPSYYVKAANAIAAGVAGAAQILTISMTDFGKPSTNVSQSTSTPTYTQEPQGMYYSVGINPMDYAEANAQQPVRAYVVDKDLKEGLEHYNGINDETTF